MDSETGIHTVADARRYREELSAREPEKDPVVAKWRVLERFTLLIVLAAVFLIFYVISVTIEILSLPTVNVSGTISPPGQSVDKGGEKPARR